MDGLDQAFSSESITFEDVKRSGIKRYAAAICDPKGTANFACVLVPDGNLLGLNGRLQDRHQRRLILANRDFLLEVVFEIIAQVFGFGFGLLLSPGGEGVEPGPAVN